MNTFRCARSIMLLLPLLSSGLALAADNSTNPLFDQVRTANDRFKDVSIAVSEGYSPIPCASGVDGGAMGIHYVNPAYLKDEAIDIARPEAVMYEPSADGKLTLIAVEYITSNGRRSFRGICSTSPARPTATASDHSTSCTSGRGRRTRKGLSLT